MKGGVAMKGLKKLAFLLVIIGGLNWLLIGIFNLNVVGYLGNVISKIVYILVGLSAVVLIFSGNKPSNSSNM
jgi:uncharacterized protein